MSTKSKAPAATKAATRSPAKKAAVSAARRAEAKGEVTEVRFTYDDHEYVIDRDAVDDLELLEAAEDGRFITAIRGFLGEEQWRCFKDAHRTEAGKVPASLLEPFLQAVADAAGLGNRSASPGS